MQASIFLAQLIGPLLLLAGVGILLNRRSLDLLADEIFRSRVFLFLFGLIDAALGLAIVLTHNVWSADWRLIITLLGWLLIVRGTARVLAPDRIKELGGRMLKNDNTVGAVLAAVTLLGLVLCYFGYTR
ncbi:MAG TPA: hypothetical protein VGF60_11495 [Xanthobacteraceae bacterium]